MKRFKLSSEDAREILSLGALPERITHSAPAVAVVLTQSWCPQWRAMDDYLDQWEREDPEDDKIHVYSLEYNNLPFFSTFLSWKEGTFKNYDIPYVRYFREGRFAGGSNYVDLPQFKRFLIDG